MIRRGNRKRKYSGSDRIDRKNNQYNIIMKLKAILDINA